jgi:hypothetical protein
MIFNFCVHTRLSSSLLVAALFVLITSFDSLNIYSFTSLSCYGSGKATSHTARPLLVVISVWWAEHWLRHCCPTVCAGRFSSRQPAHYLDCLGALPAGWGLRRVCGMVRSFRRILPTRLSCAAGLVPCAAHGQTEGAVRRRPFLLASRRLYVHRHGWRAALALKSHPRWVRRALGQYCRYPVFVPACVVAPHSPPAPAVRALAAAWQLHFAGLASRQDCRYGFEGR